MNCENHNVGKSGVTTGQAVLIAVIVVCGVALLAGAGMLLWRRRLVGQRYKRVSQFTVDDDDDDKDTTETDRML